MSATVVAPPGPHAGEVADAFATALCVMGPDAGFPVLLDQVPGAAAMVVTPDRAAHRTAGFDAPVTPPEVAPHAD